MGICTLAASVPGGRSAWQPLSFAFLAAMWINSWNKRAAECKLLLATWHDAFPHPFTEYEQSKKKGLADLAFLSGPGWWGLLSGLHQPVGSVLSGWLAAYAACFSFFNWFWVEIRCNLRRVLGSPYVPPEGGIFRAGKQNACVRCWSNGENGWRLRKKVLWEKRNLTSQRDKPSNLDLHRREQIPASRIYCVQGSSILGGWMRVHDIVQLCREDALSLLHIFFSFFFPFLFLCVMFKFIWFSDSSSI